MWLFSSLTTQHLINCHFHISITYEVPDVCLEPLTLSVQWTFLVEFINNLRHCLRGRELGGSPCEGVQGVGDQMCGTAGKGRVTVTSACDTRVRHCPAQVTDSLQVIPEDKVFIKVKSPDYYDKTTNKLPQTRGRAQYMPGERVSRF